MPPVLLALVNMILEGPNIKDQICECATQASLSIAQILKCNSVKHLGDVASSSSVRHSINQDTPLPVYVGLMLHAQTHK